MGPHAGIDVRVSSTSDGSRPLQFEDYRFFEFENAERRFADNARGRRIVTGCLPPLVQVENALFVPLGREIHDGRERVTGGLFRDDGSPIDEALLRRDQVVVFGDRLPTDPCRPHATVHEPVLYLGGQNAHFGHLLLETMARAWALGVEGMPRRVLMHDLSQTPPITFPRTPHQRAMMRGLDIGPDRLLAPSVPVRLRRVFVPAPGIVLYDHVYAAIRDSYLRIGERLGLGDEAETEQPLYLSRSALGDDFRSSVGEIEFERVLASGGFRIFHPEQHDLATQIRVVHRHRHVFGFWGSAFRLVFFSPRHKSTWQLGSEFPTSSYLLDRGVTGADAYFVRGSVACRVSDRPGDFLGVHVMRGQEVIDVLVDQGFLARPSGRLPAPPRHELVREAVFDEARRLLRRDQTDDVNALAARMQSDIDAAADQGLHLARAEVRAEREGSATVIEDAERVRRLAPDWWRTQALCGRAFAEAGRTEEAERALRAVVAVNPYSVTAYSMLAGLATSPGASITVLREAIRHVPAAGSLRRELVAQSFAQGDVEGALDLLRADLDSGADPAGNRLELALRLAELRRFDEAIQLLHDAVQRDPWHRDVLAALVRLSIAIDRPVDALLPAETLAALEPANLAHRVTLAAIAWHAHRPLLALRHAASATRLRIRRMQDKLVRCLTRAARQRGEDTPIASR